MITSVDVNYVVTSLLDYVYKLQRSRHLQQPDLQITFKFYGVGEFRRVSSNRIFWVVVHRTVRRQGKVKTTHAVFFRVMSSTQLLNLAG